MKMTDSRGGARNLEYHVKDNFVRSDMELGKDEKMSVIMDQAKQEMIILMPGQNMYMTRSLADVTSQAERTARSEDITLEKTSETEKILGYTCVKYISKSKDLTTDIWATEQLGRFMGLGNGGGPMGSKRAAAGPAWEKALMGKDFFPLRVVSHNLKGAEQFRLEAIAVEKTPQAASLFAPPPGAQKLDLGGLMQGLGFPGKK